MSTLGKILIILNALAAIGFFVIAGMDYRARQNWAYAVFRHELAINGLPLDDKDDSWRPGRPLVKDLTSDTINKMFAGSGGNPVRTQLDAVNAAKVSAIQAIDGAAAQNEKAGRDAVLAIWRPLLKLGYERERLAEEVRKRSMDELKGNVSQLFDEVASFIKSDAAVETKRAKVADLLYNFNPTGDPGLRDRAQAVVGLTEYIGAADRQASNLFAMSTRLDQILREESAIFARQYQELLPKLDQLNEQLKADAGRLEHQKKLFEQHNQLYQARKTERDDLLEQLRQAGDRAAAETTNLATLQSQLFQLQRQIAAAREANEKLEGQIRTKELGR